MVTDHLNDDRTNFKNTEVFKETYTIKNIQHRNGPVENIAWTLRPALKNTTPHHMLLRGLPGTGKTATARMPLRELAKKTSNVSPVYVNRQTAATPAAILRSIYDTVSPTQLSPGSRPLSTLCNLLGTLLTSRQKILILCLDEINYLHTDQQRNEIIGNLLRLHLTHPYVRIAIIVIANDPRYEIEEALDASTRSLFSYNDILYEPYSEAEMASILHDRARMGYYPGTISDDLVEKIASAAFKASDLRTGISLLYKCGHHAELAGRTTIEEQDVLAVIDDTNNLHIHHIIDAMHPAEQALLSRIDTVQVVAARSSSGEETGTAGSEPEQELKPKPKPMTTKELFDGVTGGDEKIISYSSFNEHIRHFASLGLMDTYPKTLPTRGRVTEIIPLYKPGDFINYCGRQKLS